MKFRMLSFLRRLDQNTIPELMLCMCWFAGSSLGCLAERFCGDAYALYVSQIPSRVPSISGVLVSAVLPFLLSASAFFLFRSGSCYFCCLFRGVCQGIMIGIISGLFGSGAPLMTLLLLFSSLSTNAVLFLFWQRRLHLKDQSLVADTAFGLVSCTLIAAADYLVIAPFLVDVINL